MTASVNWSTAGFALLDVIEPEWPVGHEAIWGQWSPLRGRLFPGTAIYVAAKAGSAGAGSTRAVSTNLG